MISFQGRYTFLLLLCSILFFGMLGSASLWDIDETSNSRAAEEMLLSGDYVVPTLNGELRTDKPPLHYWLMTLAYRVFGVNEFSARFFAAVFGTLTVLMVAGVGSTIFGPSAGFMSGLILAVSFLFTISSRSATTDAFLVFFTNAAVLAGFFASKRRSMAILCWVAMGFAVLAKGPVGLVLPLGALVLYYLLSFRAVSGLKSILNPVGIALFLVIVMPWYYLAGLRTGGDLVSGFLLKHNVDRFLKPLESHSGPFYYYLLLLMPGFFPWATFLPQTVMNGLRMKQVVGRYAGIGRLLLIWSGLVIVFFSVARTKLPTYILPAYPALALLMGAYVDSLSAREGYGRTGRTISWGAGLLPGLFFPAVFLVIFNLRIPEIRSLALVASPMFIASLTGLILHLRNVDPGRVFRWTAYVSVIGLIGIHMLLVPGLESYRMAPRIGRAIAESAVPGDKAVQMGYFRPALVFYGKKPLADVGRADQIREFVSEPGGRYLITVENRFQQLPPSLRGGFRVLMTGRDSADSDEGVMLVEWVGGDQEAEDRSQKTE